MLALAAGSACTGLATNGSGNTITMLLCTIGNILNSVIPILIVLGVVYFVWGVIQYVIGGDAESKAAGRSTMIYGIIGLAVIIAMWGLVNILITSFGLNTNTVITTPGLP